MTMRTHRMKRFFVAALVAIAVAIPSVAAARGTVLRVDGEAVYTDVGSDEGLRPGMELRLFHAITAIHPVTKKKVRDTFYLGDLTVVKTGRTISVSSAPADVLARIAAGDEVELGGKPQVVVDAWEQRVREKEAAAEGRAVEPPAELLPLPEDEEPTAEDRARRQAEAQARVDHAGEVAEVWSRTLGRPIPERVRILEDYLAEHEKSPFAGALRTEIASLVAQDRLEQTLDERAAKRRGDSADTTSSAPYLFAADVVLADPLAFSPPTRVYEGASFEISFLIVRPRAVKGAWIHYRRLGDSTYRSLEMSLDGDGYLRARLPGHDVRPPQLEYFVELLRPAADRPVAVVGSAASPAAMKVDASVAEPPRDIRHRSRVTLIVDFVDFDTSNAEDQYLQAEGDFLYRFRKPIHAVRLGFATLRGTGGPKDVIDEAEQAGRGDCRDEANVYRCRKVAFTYTYVELEMRVSALVSVMTRFIYGSAYVNADPGDSADTREYDTKVGTNLRVRIGNERETNLTIGAGIVDGLGRLAELAFTWDVIPRFPIVLTAQVTDRPIPEDYGLRLLFDIGYRGVDWVYPSVRVSYSARDIDHAGVGAGAALNFDW